MRGKCIKRAVALYPRSVTRTVGRNATKLLEIARKLLILLEGIAWHVGCTIVGCWKIRFGGSKMSLRFYGNDEETYVAVTRAVSGTEFYCVQSPDLSATEGNFVQVDVLPETVRELDNVRPEDLG